MSEGHKTLPIPFGWYCIGYSDELKPGEHRSVFYFNRRMVLFRGESGQLSLISAYCPHLGANLGEGGTVVQDSMQCPFHGWRFDGDGHCVEVPYATKIPPRAKGKCLDSYIVQEVNGMVWTWYHPENAEPSFEVERMKEVESGEWTDYQKKQWRFKSHVQETGENAVDSAHFEFVHKIGGITEKPEITFVDHRRESYLYLAMSVFDEQGEKIEGEYIDGVIFTANCGPGQTWTRQKGMADLLIIGLPTPVSETEVELRFACSVPKAQKGEQEIISQAIIQNAMDQVEQDMPIWEHKIYQEDPILCDGDGPIAQYRKWFKQFYA